MGDNKARPNKPLKLLVNFGLVKYKPCTFYGGVSKKCKLCTMSRQQHVYSKYCITE